MIPTNAKVTYTNKCEVLSVDFSPNKNLDYCYKFTIVENESLDLILLWDTGNGGMWFYLERYSLKHWDWDSWIALITQSHCLDDRDAAAIFLFLRHCLKHSKLKAHRRHFAPGERVSQAYEGIEDLQDYCEYHFESIRIHEISKIVGQTNESIRATLVAEGLCERAANHNASVPRREVDDIVWGWDSSNKDISPNGIPTLIKGISNGPS